MGAHARVLVTLDALELEQVQRDLVVDQAIVGSILSIQTRDRRLGLEAMAPLAIKLLLGGSCLGTNVVELRVEVKRLAGLGRSEEHTSELQSLRHLVCRLLL